MTGMENNMKSFLHLAKSRRSIRAYEKREIDRQDLRLCVEAARFAPSACHSQPWKFIIIDNPDVKKRVSENIFSGLYQMNEFARDAAAFIAIVSEKMKFPAWMGGKLKNTDFKRIDIGIACEHIVLQARELGIGTCILGWFNERKLKKILSVPAAKRIELVIALGYAARADKPEKILKNKNETVSFNKY